MVLPEGFALPPLPQLIALLAVDAAVVGLLWRSRPAVTEATVVALVPWMVVGAGLHVLHELAAAPAAIAPLLGTPAVYLAVAALAGGVWLAATAVADAPATVARATGIGGLVAVVPTLAAVAAAGRPLRPGWSAIGLLVSVVLAAAAWAALRALVPAAAAAAGRVGMVVVFGHALDGVSTALGVDVLGFGERSPASRAVMAAAGTLPTADLLGVGWLFVAVKLAVAGGVIALFDEYIEEAPAQAYLLLAIVAAVGLGPGTYNLLLYAVR